MSFAARPSQHWHVKSRALALGSRTLVMGILNVTPDSFSDGGVYFSDQSPEQTVEKAVARALTMLEEGADLLDIGGESTRPGAVPLRPEEEQARILPVIQAIVRERPEIVLSVDTYHAETARLALEAGVEIVNDVSGLMWDRGMASVMAEGHCGVVLMHARGTPGQWATLPPLDPAEIVPTVSAGLTESLRLAQAAGISADRIVLDPGFGFGKRGVENFTLHAELGRLQELGFPLLVGTSRKGFLAPRDAPAETRLQASMASNVAAVLSGAHVIRTHDVAPTRAACGVADAILAGAARLG